MAKNMKNIDFDTMFKFTMVSTKVKLLFWVP